MKLKDLEKVIKPVYVRLEQKNETRCYPIIFEGDRRELHAYIYAVDPALKERKVYSITAINNILYITLW